MSDSSGVTMIVQEQRRRRRRSSKDDQDDDGDQWITVESHPPPSHDRLQMDTRSDCGREEDPVTILGRRRRRRTNRIGYCSYAILAMAIVLLHQTGEY